MLFDFPTIVTYINTFSPLQKGDFIFTGTPEGVGEFKRFDKFRFVLPELNLEESGEF